MPSDLHSLAARAEAADPSEQREVLNAAFRAIHGEKPPRVLGGSDALTSWLYRYNPFFKMLDAEAYESAAMMLLPPCWRAGFEEGAICDANPDKSMAWVWPFGSDYDPDWQLGQTQASNPDGHRAFASTPALALVAAALRARATQGENDG
jgi:hypothetical protein